MLLEKNTNLSNRYRVESHLGSGGMAEVYKVWGSIRRVHLACKILKDDLADDVVFLRRFRQEAQILSEFQQPNLVSCYGFDEDKDSVFLLLDFINRPTLLKVIKFIEGIFYKA